MFDEEVEQISNKATESKNLKFALLSLGLLILYEVISYSAANSFYPGHSHMLSRLLVILSYGSMLLCVIVAIISLSRSFMGIQKTKNSRSYVAIGIPILVLLIMAIEIMSKI